MEGESPGLPHAQNKEGLLQNNRNKAACQQDTLLVLVSPEDSLVF